MSKAYELMDKAREAEATAASLREYDATSGVNREYIIERQGYFAGLASGLRKAARIVAELEGVNLHD